VRAKSPEGTKAPASKRNGGVGAPGGAGPSTASRSVAGAAAQAPPEEPARAPARPVPEGTQPPAAASEGTGHAPPAEHESRPPGEGAESASEAPSVSTPPATTPLTGAPAGAGATPPGATSPRPKPSQPSSEAAAGAAPAPAPGAAAESAPPAPTRAIDRLHLATAAAEQRGDLRALRSMRDTWKNFLQRAGVGPDRIRAKRELADCLWAIQELTGRRSDQREALRAYRDFLLNAPAGGADARTVGRAKQLQDAVSESN